MKGLTLEEELVGNLSMSLSFTLSKNEEFEHHIRLSKNVDRGGLELPFLLE